MSNAKFNFISLPIFIHHRQAGIQFSSICFFHLYISWHLSPYFFFFFLYIYFIFWYIISFYYNGWSRKVSNPLFHKVNYIYHIVSCIAGSWWCLTSFAINPPKNECSFLNIFSFEKKKKFLVYTIQKLCFCHHFYFLFMVLQSFF